MDNKAMTFNYHKVDKVDCYKAGFKDGQRSRDKELSRILINVRKWYVKNSDDFEDIYVEGILDVIKEIRINANFRGRAKKK